MTQLFYKVGSMETPNYATALEYSRDTGLPITKKLVSYYSCRRDDETGSIELDGPIVNEEEIVIRS